MTPSETITSGWLETDLHLALDQVEQELERAGAIENPLERFWLQEWLLEQRETLQTALDETTTHPRRY